MESECINNRGLGVKGGTYHPVTLEKGSNSIDNMNVMNNGASSYIHKYPEKFLQGEER